MDIPTECQRVWVRPSKLGSPRVKACRKFQAVEKAPGLVILTQRNPSYLQIIWSGFSDWKTRGCQPPAGRLGVKAITA